MRIACRLSVVLLTIVVGLPTAGLVRAQTATIDWPIQKPPAPLTRKELQFPAYEVRTLKNGLQVIAVLQHEQPIVSMRLLIGAGSAHDSVEQLGLAQLLATLLDQGTTTRNAKEIAETIDTVGGAIGVGAGADLSFVNVVVMKDSFELALDLLADIARNPAFSSAEISRQRQRILSGLQVALDDPSYIADTVFAHLVYGLHPYGQLSSGTPESLASISRDDLLAFHKTYYAPNTSLLAIVGDLTADEAFDGAARVFGDWESKEIPELILPDSVLPKRRLVVVDRPGAVQTEIRVGHLGVPRQNSDYIALDLATRILGGEGSNRLHRILRSERSLTYGAEANMHAWRYGGDFQAETNTRSEATAEVVRLIIEEFWRLQQQRVDPRELGEAQNYLSGSFPLQIETPNAIAMRVLDNLFYKLDLSELSTYQERVNVVTVDDIQRVARDYLMPDRLSMVLVGDADTFVDDLPNIGLQVFERVALSELDLMTASLILNGPFEQTSDVLEFPGSQQEYALSIIDRAIKVKGGIDRLKSVQTVTAFGNMTMFTATGPVDAGTVVYLAYPEQFRVETDLPTGQVIQAYNSGDAWLQSIEGVREAPQSLRNDFQASLRRDLIPLLLRAASGELDIRLTTSANSDSLEPLAVEISSEDMAPVNIYLDPKTGLVIRQTYRTEGEDGMQETEELYSDYRDVDGVLVAFRSIVRRNGFSVLERQLTKLSFNETLSQELFTKPAEQR